MQVYIIDTINRIVLGKNSHVPITRGALQSAEILCLKMEIRKNRQIFKSQQFTRRLFVIANILSEGK